MTPPFTEAQSDVTSRLRTLHGSNGHDIQPLAKQELAEVLRALEVPFEVNLVQWRVT